MVNVSQVGGTFLDKLVDSIIPPNVVNFLNTTLYKNQFIILNYWSIVHFVAGILFYKFISKNFKLWLKINIIFEIVEFVLAFGGNPLFVEELVDIVWDIILSLLGFMIVRRWFK